MTTHSAQVPSRWACFLLIAALGACSDVTFEGGGPVSIQISASATSVQTGQSVSFQYSAVGTFLSGIVLEYGDGTADSVTTFGAQTSSGSMSHSWESPGQYTVVGKAVDASQGTATTELSIQVSASSGSE